MEEAWEEWRAGQDKGKEKAKIFLLLLKSGSFFECYARTKRGGLQTDYNALLR